MHFGCRTRKETCCCSQPAAPSTAAPERHRPSSLRTVNVHSRSSLLHFKHLQRFPDFEPCFWTCLLARQFGHLGRLTMLVRLDLAAAITAAIVLDAGRLRTTAALRMRSPLERLSNQATTERLRYATLQQRWSIPFRITNFNVPPCRSPVRRPLA